ncbi:hypothetical protein B0H14DRAFT_2614566 [Mycena olivaceomarginata]|nr:hypothetical protein B0H14DRAFT_2614566 [Mycena olivaceomarginata]
MALETVPPEIWAEITGVGRALSLVSRAAHLVSKPLKYQPLLSLDSRELLKLLAVLRELPPGARRVKYLFVGGLDGSKGFEDPDGRAELQGDFVGVPVRCRTSLKRPSVGSASRGSKPRTFASTAAHFRHPCSQDRVPALGRAHSARAFPVIAPYESSASPISPESTDHHLLPSGEFSAAIVHAAPSLINAFACAAGLVTPYAVQVALGILQPVDPILKRPPARKSQGARRRA